MPEDAWDAMQDSRPPIADMLFNDQLDPRCVDFMTKVRRAFIDEAEKTGNYRF